MDQTKRISAEIDRIRQALAAEPDQTKALELRAANQALSWALEPQGAAAPFPVIMGIQAEREDYLAECRPPQS